MAADLEVPGARSLKPLYQHHRLGDSGAYLGSTARGYRAQFTDLGSATLFNALKAQDLYLAGSFILLLSLLTVIGTFLSDIALAWLDPRIRLK